jgi:hypothetical protein
MQQGEKNRQQNFQRQKAPENASNAALEFGTAGDYKELR